MRANDANHMMYLDYSGFFSIYVSCILANDANHMMYLSLLLILILSYLDFSLL